MEAIGLKAVLTREAMVLDAEATRKVRRTAYSASTSKTFASNCTALFAFNKIAGPPSPNLEAATDLGTAAHAVLEELYKLPPAKRTERRAVNILIALSSTWQKTRYPELSNAATLAMFQSAVIERYRGIFQIEDPRKTEVVRTEWPLHGVRLRGVPFTGFVDLATRVHLRGKTGLQIIDHKSSAKMPDKRKIELYGDEHGDQVRLYAAAMRTIQDEPVIQGRLNYTKLGSSRIVGIGPSLMKETLDGFAASWERHNEQVEAQRFPVKVSPLCGWCPLVAVCPAAQAEGKEDRVGGALSRSDALRLIEVDDSQVTATAPSRQSTPPPTDTSSGEDVPEHDTSTEEGEDMSDTARMSEDKPWEEYGNDSTLNGNSYASTALFGTSTWAAELMHEHDIAMHKTTLHSIAHLLADIITEIQESLTGRRAWMDGTNTRVRGVLRAVVCTVPPPFGEDAEQWQTWRTAVVKRSKAICGTAMRLHAADYDFTVDYEALGSITPKHRNETPDLPDA